MTISLRRFGGTSLTVSQYGLGCARIGGIFQREPGEFLNLLAAARDAGITFFDTADMYTQGESETLLGRAFRHCRDEVVIASKVGYVLPTQRRLVARVKPFLRPLIGALGLRRHHLPGSVSGSLAQDFSPAYLSRAVEGSLRRLATDRIDILQLHSPPVSTVAQGDWLDVLERLKQHGKIRYYGISCDSVAAAEAALAYPGVSTLQVVINLLEPRMLDSILPRARARGVAVIARECLANGLLAKDAAEIDVASYCDSPEEAERKTNQLRAFRAEADEAGRTLADLALEFVTELEGVSVALVGVSRRQQLDALVTSGSLATRRNDRRGALRPA